MLCRILLTVTIQWEGKCHPRKTLCSSKAFQMKSCFWWALEAAIWFWPRSQGFHWLSCAVDFAGGYPLALLCSLHFYHLCVFFHEPRTPDFISTKVFLPPIASPWPACPNNFAAVAPSLSCAPHPLSVCLSRWGCGAAGREGKWMRRLASASCSGWWAECGGVSARLQSLRTVQKRM